MNAHVMMVLYTGAAFLAAGCCLLEVCRLLGKSYENRPSAGWPWRALHFVAAAVLFGYGVVVLFPGQVLRVQHMSIGLPLVASVVLGGALAYLDHVMGEREPPPWSHQLLRLIALLGIDGLSRRAAFAFQPAAIDDGPPPLVGRARGVRLAVLTGAIATIAAVAGFILVNSATA